MEETNFLQNIYSILVLIFTTPFYLEMFIFFLISFAMMITFIIKKDKKVRKILLLIYAILIILLFGYYGKFLLYLFDKIMDLLFGLIYFPNAVIYFLVLVIVNINTIFSLFDGYKKIKFLSNRSDIIINIVNVICFLAMHLFFFMILDIVINNNLDFFSQSSIYANQTFRILVQASTIIFVINTVTVGLIILYRRIVSLQKKKDKPNNIPNETINAINQNIEFNNSNLVNNINDNINNE